MRENQISSEPASEISHEILPLLFLLDSKVKNISFVVHLTRLSVQFKSY